MSGLAAWLLGLPGPAVYALVGLLVFAEDALFFGFLLPGETAAVLGGVATSRGRVALPVMMAVVVVAAVAGDLVGYLIGRRLGPRLLDRPALRRRSGRARRALDLLARRGGPAVFLGRFVAFLRAVIPALAGAVGMPMRTFLPFNVAGGLVWGVLTVLLGHLAGDSYLLVERSFGRFAGLAVAAIGVVAVLVWRLRGYVRRRHSRAG